MRTQHVLLASFLLLAAACAPSCAGTKARTDVLWPQVAGIWPAIKQDIEHQSNRPLEPPVVAGIAHFELAVQGDDWRQLQGLDWDLLRSKALSGISARVSSGEVSAGVAESLRERVTQFDLAIKELLGR